MTNKYAKLNNLFFKCPCGVTQIITEKDTEAFRILTNDSDNISSLGCGCVLLTGYEELNYIDEDINREIFEAVYTFCGYTDREKLFKEGTSSKIQLIKAKINCVCEVTYPIIFNKLNDFNYYKGDCQCGSRLEFITMNQESLGLSSDDDFDDDIEDNLEDEEFDNILDFEALKAEIEEKEADTSQLDKNKIILSLKIIGKCEIKPFKKKKYHK